MATRLDAGTDDGTVRQGQHVENPVTTGLVDD